MGPASTDDEDAHGRRRRRSGRLGVRDMTTTPTLRSLSWPPCSDRWRGARAATPALAQDSAEESPSSGVMHLREGRVDLALEEFKRAVEDDPKNPYFQKGLGLAYAAERDWKKRSAVPQGARAQPVLRRRAQRPRHRPHPARATARRGRRSSSPPTPTRPTRRPRSRPGTSARPTSRRRTTPRPSTGSGPASAATRTTPTPTSASPRRSSAPVGSTRRSSPARGGRRGLPGRPRPAPRPRAGLLQGRALRRGARAASRRRCGRTPPGRSARPRPRSSRACPAESRPLPYRRILETLLARVAGARTALLLDAQGEVVVGAGDLGERQRLIGAYQGITLGMAFRAATALPGGRHRPPRLAPRGRQRRDLAAQGRLLPRGRSSAPRRSCAAAVRRRARTRGRSSTRRSSGPRRPPAGRALPHARGPDDAPRGPRPGPAAPRRGGPRVGRGGPPRRRHGPARGGGGHGGARGAQRRDRPGGLPAMRERAARGDPARPRAAGRCPRRSRRGRGSCSWWASTAPARPPRSASSPRAGAREGRSVLVCAADTFRAAAAEQLEVWAERRRGRLPPRRRGGGPVGGAHRRAARGAGQGPRRRARGHRGPAPHAGRTSWPSSPRWPAWPAARSRARPTRPCSCSTPPWAATGSPRAASSRRRAGVTGLVLTKLDGTARGGVAVAVVRELGVPIRYVGVGETVEDLLPFDADAFAASLVGEE